MSTPSNAPYKLKQQKYRDRVNALGKDTPSKVYVEYNRNAPKGQRYAIFNRATRRKLGLA